MDGEIGHEELEAVLEEDDARIVDIRNPQAFTRGHIPGSENVPLDRLVDDVERFDGAGRVVTVCPHGQASQQAARLLAAYEGVEGPVESFAPGLSAWDGPLESGQADQSADDDGASDGESDAVGSEPPF